MDSVFDEQKLIRFWWWSRSPRSRYIRVRIRVRAALMEVCALWVLLYWYCWYSWSLQVYLYIC